MSLKASNNFEKAILTYLDEVKSTYPNLSEALKQEGKTITDCCNYIIQEVKKKKVNAMTNDEVFSLATAYYLSEKEIKTEKINCQVIVGNEIGSTIKTSPEIQEKPKKKIKEIKPTDGKQLSMFDLIS